MYVVTREAIRKAMRKQKTNLFNSLFPESFGKCDNGWEVGPDNTCYQINADHRKIWAGMCSFG